MLGAVVNTTGDTPLDDTTLFKPHQVTCGPTIKGMMSQKNLCVRGPRQVVEGRRGTAGGGVFGR